MRRPPLPSRLTTWSNSCRRRHCRGVDHGEARRGPGHRARLRHGPGALFGDPRRRQARGQGRARRLAATAQAAGRCAITTGSIGNGATAATMRASRRDWVIVRGDQLVPAARARLTPGARNRSRGCEFKLPEGWTGVDTPYRAQRGHGDRSRSMDPGRSFVRPVGWMIAGELGIRREWLDGCTRSRSPRRAARPCAATTSSPSPTCSRRS
jgi:hypothetical protein